MQNTVNTAEFLPYAITYPVIAVNRGATTTITITATISAVDYQNAWVGSYSDTVTITINP